MADKVQRILEDVLQESIYLVKKGIFTEGELKRQMANRQRLQNGLVKKTLRVTDYLKTIEYEYEQQRIRKYRQSEESETVIDPKYKRASTKDFTIVKRIIRLWDRTLHKYKFRVDLWKQYLWFCHVIKSRKAFYKALSNAVKFNPFELDLWMAGAAFEFQVVKNPWRARKIFHKALKLNKGNINFWKEYLKFQCQFAQLIAKRESGLAEENVIRFQGEPEEPSPSHIDFRDLLKQVVSASMQAIDPAKKLQLMTSLSTVLNEYRENTIGPTIVIVLQSIQQVIKKEFPVNQQTQHLLNINYKKYIMQLHQSFESRSNQQKLDILKHFQPQERVELLRKINMGKLKTKERVEYFREWSKLMVQNKNIDHDIIVQAIKQLCFNPEELATFVLSVVDLAPQILFKKLVNHKTSVHPSITTYYLNNYRPLSLSTFQIDILIKRTNKDYNNIPFLKASVMYNSQTNREKDNLKLLQCLRVSYSPKILQEASTFLSQKTTTTGKYSRRQSNQYANHKVNQQAKA